MRIAKSVAELIGRTPMLELTHFEQTHCLNAHLLAKVESFNPAVRWMTSWAKSTKSWRKNSACW